ncbi:MAG: DMT family transporter [Chloroflexota bacterium]|nr:DMT family transporter [Chloroflexota bacterium]
MDPQTTVVVLGLASAGAWGAADFGGGFAGRRAPLLGVLLATQILGGILAAGIAAIRAEPLPQGNEVVLAGLAGIVGAIGLGALYAGLSTGRMGVVAPISGVLSAIVPVTAGIVLEGLPQPASLIGIGLALVAVVLVSSSPAQTPDGAPQQRVLGLPRDVAIALLAGLSIGVFNIVVSRFGPGSVFAPLVIVRVVEAAVIVGAIVATGRAWRTPRRVWPLLVVVGALDMAGNGFFILASQAGRLDIAAVLASLYPVTTLILAALILKERVAGVHALGVAAAIVAIVLVRIG